MTAAWSTSDAIRDASDQRADAADDALGEVMAAWDGAADEERGDVDEGRAWDRGCGLGSGIGMSSQGSGGSDSRGSPSQRADAFTDPPF